MFVSIRCSKESTNLLIKNMYLFTLHRSCWKNFQVRVNWNEQSLEAAKKNLETYGTVNSVEVAVYHELHICGECGRNKRHNAVIVTYLGIK